MMVAFGALARVANLVWLGSLLPLPKTRGRARHARRMAAATSRTRAVAIAVLLQLAALMHGCGDRLHPGTAIPSSRVAPHFTAVDLAGRGFDSSSMHGHITVLFIWAAWHCSDELAALDDVATRLLPHRANVVAVSIDRERGVVSRVARSRAGWALTFLHDPSGRVARVYDPSGFPAVYVIDSAGRIQHAYYDVGLVDLPAIEASALKLSGE